MLHLGSLSFAAPWALLALAVLPVIWWLLRLTPPAPRLVAFPPLRLLLKLFTEEKSSAKTPPWLLLLRLLLAAMVILAAARPLIDERTLEAGDGPLLIVVDDGWSAAPGWDKRRDLMIALTSQAQRTRRPVAILTTAPVSPGEDRGQLTLASGRQMSQLAERLQPRPWPVDRLAALKELERSGSVEALGAAQVVWLSDGLETGDAAAFAEGLARFGEITLFAEAASGLAHVLRPPVSDGGILTVRAERADDAAEEMHWIRAFAEDGRLLAREALTFETGETAGEVRIELPSELANRLVRLDLADAGSAAGVVLLDERWRRRPVGLVTSEGGADLPLLSSIFYLKRALDPYTEVREGTVRDLLRRELAVLVMADTGRLSARDRRATEDWIAAGGVAVRFAGPLLAQAPGGLDPTLGRGGRGAGGLPAAQEPLLPVPLRRGDRVIGGAMSWSQPAKLAPFDDASPFHGLSLPEDVVVRRQVLAQPTLDLTEKTWARLTDGTPLVTAAKQGEGWLVLIHTTANTQWSNLALSGLFVEMMQRLVALSQGVATVTGGPPLEPVQTFDAAGQLGTPPADAKAIRSDVFAETVPSAAHPPGFYGRGAERRALNLGAGLPEPAPIGGLPVSVERTSYGVSPAVDLRPWFLTLAMLLALADFAISLAFRGLLRPGLRKSAAVGALAACAVALPVLFGAPAQAADDGYAIENSGETRLAYVLTGDSKTDQLSRLGLRGLSLIVRRRTAAELAEPRGVDPARDELAFFPLLYWPVVAGAADIGDGARARLNTYLRNGGTILFDTRDRSGGAGLGELRRLADRLDIPPLVPVSPNHVLTRSFYLLQEFPGRWTGEPLWVEQAGDRINDGVSPVIAGTHDWASAWALDETSQQPLYPVVPGGERQREMAFRFGINLVMYTLTGNYKADQVHLPAIIQRLGQ